MLATYRAKSDKINDLMPAGAYCMGIQECSGMHVATCANSVAFVRGFAHDSDAPECGERVTWIVEVRSVGTSR